MYRPRNRREGVVLIEIAEHADIKSAEALASLERLKRIRAEIERIKRSEYAARAADIAAQVAELRRKGGMPLLRDDH